MSLPLPAPLKLDSCLQLETPEGIDLLLRPAGPVSRARAWLIDSFCSMVLIMLLSLLLSGFDVLGKGLLTILFFVINWGYPILFEVLWQGRTLGKKVVGLCVVHDDGTPIGWPASIIRNLLRTADMLPFGYGVGLASCLLQKQFKRLGDLAAGTLVVYQPKEVEARPELPIAEPVRLPFVLPLDEQRALLDFAERSGQLSSARRVELASIVAPALGVSDDEAEHQLKRVARGLLEAA